MKIKAKIKNTENPEKLMKNIKKIIPTAELNIIEEKVIEGRGNFKEIWELAEKQKIKNTLMHELEKNKRKEKTFLELDKTASSEGKISTYINSASGNIRLEIPWLEVEKTKQIDG